MFSEVTLKIRGKSYRFDGMIAKATGVASNFVNFTDSSNFTRQGMPQIKTCQFQRELSSKSGRCMCARVRKRNSAGNGAECREFLKFSP